MELQNPISCGFWSSSLANLLLQLLVVVAMNLSMDHASAANQFQNETDQLALLQFKHQITYDPFGVLNSWNHSQHQCQWQGVTCSTRRQRVTAVTLLGNLFHGNLPTNIGLKLPNLQQLLIGGNNFKGNIPISITNASALERLDLPTNKFEGRIPTNLGDLPRLQKIDLAHNLLGTNFTRDLDFIASLTNCSNLKSIWLDDNNFGGEIPKAVANLSHQFSELRIKENLLSGTIPEGLGNLVNLYTFDVAGNSLSGFIPSDFDKFQNLQYLSLRANKFSGEILPVLCNISSLYHLDLSNNRFEGNIFGNVHMNCQNLQERDISENNLSGVISPLVFKMTSSLVNMILRKNRLSGYLPVEVENLIHVGLFDVSYNNFSGEIPTTIVDCSNLEYLYTQANSFHGSIPRYLASLKSIQELDLSSNNLTGQIPRDLEKLQFLRYLNLSFNDLEGEIPTTGIFGNASQISLIGNNKLCGGIPELNFPSCPMIKRKNKAKLKVIIVLSTILPVMVLVLGTLLVYYVMYQRRYRRKTNFSSVPARVDKLLRLSYYELHRSTSGFSPGNLIGFGSFGVVYKGRLDQHGNKLVAVKVLDLQKNGASKSFKAE